MKVFFSIVVPVYNRAASIERCITSVINQNFTDWELLLIDDGSTDGSLEIIHKFYTDDPRIKLLKRPLDRKKGANACRNLGIEKASGKYIAFLDSDDEWKPDRLKNAHQFLALTDFHAIYSGGVIFNGVSESKRYSRQISFNESPVDFLLSDETFAPTPSMVVERELARLVKFDENLLRNQDYDFFIRLHFVQKWIFFDCFDIVIHWIKGEDRNHHLDSNITFCEKYKSLFHDQNLLYKYNYNYWLISRKIRSDKAEYFLNEMKKIFWKVDIKNKIRYMFRSFLLYYYLKKKII